MAHTKAGGSTRQKGNRRGKHMGVKIYGGQKVNLGGIIVRQRGSAYHPGANVKLGRDFTLYALKKGIVQFIKRSGRQLITIK